MPRSLRLTQPPNRIVTAAIGLLTEEQVGQIDAIWLGLDGRSYFLPISVVWS